MKPWYKRILGPIFSFFEELTFRILLLEEFAAKRFACLPAEDVAP